MVNGKAKNQYPASGAPGMENESVPDPAGPVSFVDYMKLAPSASWLRFPSFIEEQYKIDYHNSNVQTIRLAFFAGFIIYSAFGIMDYFGAPFSYPQAWFIRFGIGCPALALTIAATYVPRLARYMQLIGCTTAVIAGWGIVRIIQITRPDELINSHYYAGIILVMLFTSSWLRLRFWYALTANTLIIIYYEYVAIYSQRLLSTPESQLLFFGINFLLLGGYIIAAFTCYSFERHNRMDFLQRRTIEEEKNKSNAQRVELEGQANELSKVVASLNKTQTRLVHSEKMASLGELTAGIAHEIQNPLNFVNNFSDINIELIRELEIELQRDNKKEARSLADDIKENQQKIIHHGRRADAIVKSMLQHSRVSSGNKEPTDINALADNYLKLGYHGMRAKDKAFNTALSTHFDVNIGQINVVPQDMGRVLLNLYNNAFYSVTEKKKSRNGNFEPRVSVTTKKEDRGISIVISDNGTGISEKAMGKIFQPFFTTKPTGEGTGLGLSICYDIIKAHNGEIKVDSKEGEGAEFIIELPA